MEETIDDTERLMRRGDVLNLIGLLRCAALYNYSITFEQWTYLVNRNYMITEIHRIPGLEQEIQDVWNNAKDTFAELKLLKSWSPSIISIRDPRQSLRGRMII
jgi:hypothetical protein